MARGEVRDWQQLEMAIGDLLGQSGNLFAEQGQWGHFYATGYEELEYRVLEVLLAVVAGASHAATPAWTHPAAGQAANFHYVIFVRDVDQGFIAMETAHSNLAGDVHAGHGQRISRGLWLAEQSHFLDAWIISPGMVAQLAAVNEAWADNDPAEIIFDALWGTPGSRDQMEAVRKIERAVREREGGGSGRKFDGLDGLAAAPGDIDGFVNEIAEQVEFYTTEAFRRAALTVAGVELGARAEGVWAYDDGEPIDLFVQRGETRYFNERRTAAYAWFARQFVRGAMGESPLGPYGPVAAGMADRNIYQWQSADHPLFAEARLGLDLWRLGRNVAAEPHRMADPDFIGPCAHGRDPYERCIDCGELTAQDAHYRALLARILEAVRVRLNWPRLPNDYDPPPPSQWPEDQ